jgi:hypothetical protein
MAADAATRLRIGDVKATDSTYRGFLSGVPFMYTVDGMPVGERAVIALFGRSWKILRVVGDDPGTWNGDFQTPQDAVAGLATQVCAPPSGAEAGPQPYDGIARQDEDGRWTVYQVEPDGGARKLEGPYERDEAIARLRSLVPVDVGDQWVIDVWGVSHTLN